MTRNKLVVQKYGGSSLSSTDKIGNVAEKIISKTNQGYMVVVVVSAMGDSTDNLISLASQVNSNANTITREMDILLSTGELVSSTLMTLSLIGKNKKAVSLSGTQAGIMTDSVHGSARISDININRIQEELNKDSIVVVAGFQGLNNIGDVTTLGRGGSDTTAVGLAVALNAERCEIYTDVEGIYTTDPRITKKARKLDEISFEEMLEMASLGAKMNPRSIELGLVYNMPVYVASSFSLEQGTLIHGSSNMEIRKAVTGIAVDKNVAKITVKGVIDQPGIAAELLRPLSDAGISIDVIVQNTSSDGTTDFTYTVSESNLERAVSLMNSLDGINYKNIESGKDLAKLSIVGTGMENSPGYASKMFSVLSSLNVNIDMITTSEIRITTIINKNDIEKSVVALHDAFELETP
ncbi:MAG: aspartate kinase [SAR202 cluster bacterium]|nr:aspartate kinase [SAR202 cluster bacterium]|tara:strand:+ start:1338 stop:2564 length:1227 start_codon:yes stop_codon:yes gene_type:complete